MSNSKAYLHKLALELYELHDRNISEVARDPRMPSRISLIKWKKSGKPITITGGKTWDDYLDQKTEQMVHRANVQRAQQHGSFLDEALDGIEHAFRVIKAKIDAGDFEAKPADLEKMVKLYMQLDQRDQDQQNWMHDVMIKLLTIISDVVTLEQFTVIRQKFQNYEREKSKSLDLVIDKGMPELPAFEQVQFVDEEVPVYQDFTETS